MGSLANETSKKEAFVSEAALVEQFMALLREGVSPWGDLLTTTEWDYRTGITDVLARTADGQLVAFEAKLTDWRRASHQAYRNTTFAGRVYVVMPTRAAERTRAHEALFARYGIGLCSVDADRIRVLIEAPDTEPLLPWLHKRAHSYFDKVASDHGDQPRRGRSRSMQTA